MAIIKQSEEDFIVKELYGDFKIERIKSEYAYFILMKKGLTTTEAIERISSKLRIDAKDIGFAGNKDKRALTFQLISIPTFFIKDETLSEIDENVSLEFFGYSKEPIKIGDLKGNLFEIIVRDCKLKLPSKVENFLLPNYFDDQRFSLNNIVIGESIVKNDFRYAITNILKYSFPDAEEKFGFWRDFDINKADHISRVILEHLFQYPKDLVGAIRKIPVHISMMYIHAYQSFLFNEILNIFSDTYFKKKYKIKIMNREYWCGDELIKYLDRVYIPLIGFATEIEKYSLYDIGSIVLELMAKHEITFRDFVIHSYPLLSTTGTERKAYLFVDIEIEKVGKSDYKLMFSLPSGSYGTILVKSLLAKMGEDVIIES
ncbi:MAG: tRNA pseudouridine(13) synthase TruD [Candidatus Woesearchaeota archaeon]